MNPILVATLRKHWPAAGALAVLALLSVVNTLWFSPTASRYSKTIQRAAALGMPLDPNQMPRMMPPRLFALIADNSLPAAQVQEAANSGSLTAEFLGEVTDRLGRRSLTVVSTEPGAVSQDQRTIQLRAHLRARGRYTDFVLLLDDFANDRRLFGIDRFTVTPEETGGTVFVDLWMSRLVLKSGVKS